MVPPGSHSTENSGLLLASASDIVKTWEIDKQGVLHHRLDVSALAQPGRPAGGTPSFWHCVKWNHNNQVVACGREQGEIALVHESGKVLETLRETAEGPMGARQPPILALAWGGRSRYLATTGGADRSPSLWDLKRKVRVRAFKGHRAPVTAVTFHPDDLHVASGNRRGEVLLHQIKSEDALHVLSPSAGQGAGAEGVDMAAPVRGLSYWPLRPHYLLGAYEDGNVRVWDSGAGACVATFRSQHQGAVTAVAGSTVNNKLLATAGLDRRLLLFDVSQRKLLKECRTVAGVTDMVFHPEGTLILAGCANGDVLVYDLRRPTQPCCSMNAHHPLPVRSISVQSSRRDKPASRPSSLASPSSQSRAPSTPSDTASDTPRGPPSPARSTTSILSLRERPAPAVPHSEPPPSVTKPVPPCSPPKPQRPSASPPRPPKVSGSDAKLFEEQGPEARATFEWKGGKEGLSKEPSAAAEARQERPGQAANGVGDAAGGGDRRAVQEMVANAVEDGLDGVMRAVQQMHVEMVRIDTLAASRMAAMEGLVRELMEENVVLRKEVERMLSLGNPYL